jgi:hypothetical protein
MILSILFIQEKFKTFNALIFDNQLPEIPVYLTSARTFLGKCTFRSKRNLLGKTTFFDFALRFSKLFDMPERDWEDVIIHEMIHYYIGVKNLKDTSAHGTLFRRMMVEINRTHHRNITISHRKGTPSTVMVVEKKPRFRVIAYMEMSDGKTGFKVLPRTRQGVFSFYRKVQLSPMIKRVSFFWSDHPFFAQYPCSAAARVFFAEEAALKKYLENAEPISKDDIIGE